MSTRKFIVDVEIPDCDGWFHVQEDLEMHLQDILDAECDDEGRWKVNVKEICNPESYKDKLCISSLRLYRDIDRCITNLVDARRYKNGKEGEALHTMESLMVVSLQQLGCVIDYLEKEDE